MINLNSIYASNKGRLPIVQRSVYGIGALIILLNAAFMYVNTPALVSININETNKTSHSLAEVFEETSLPVLQLEEERGEIKASNCTHPGCNCTPENHCGCLDPSSSESCHTGHGNNNHEESDHKHSQVAHSDNSGESNKQHICGCITDSNAQGPATSNNTLSENWFIELHVIDFQLKSLFILSTDRNLKETLLPEEIFRPPA